MTSDQMGRVQLAATVLIILQWLTAVPFANLNFEGWWPLQLTQRPNAIWAWAVAVISLCLGVFMIWLSRQISRTLSRSSQPEAQELTSGAWAMATYGLFAIGTSFLAVATLKSTVFNTVRAPLMILIITMTVIFIPSGVLFLRRLKRDKAKEEWHRLFLRPD